MIRAIFRYDVSTKTIYLPGNLKQLKADNLQDYMSIIIRRQKPQKITKRKWQKLKQSGKNL